MTDAAHPPPTMTRPIDRRILRHPRGEDVFSRSPLPAVPETDRSSSRNSDESTGDSEGSVWTGLRALGEGIGRVGFGTLSLLAALFPAGCTCSHESVEAEGESAVAEAEEPIEWLDRRPLVLHTETELDGDPAVGTVLFIRQVHMIPEEFLERMPAAHQRRATQEATRYQFEILRELERLGVGDIFAETIYAENEVGMNVDSEGTRMLSTMFPSIPESYESLTRDQAAALAALGADHVYRFRHSSTHLHTASDLELTNDMLRAIEGLHPGERPEGPMFERLDGARETFAVQRIMDFLHENPGRSVVLVYGADHEFRDDFARAGYAGRLVSYSWTRE